tara:strand:+ start:20402 stop:20629 length:228 start_codon:yes stop_codon:yes gene_type:complete
MSENNAPVLKELDLSEDKAYAEVTVDVPADEGNGQSYKYNVKVSKQKMTDRLLANDFENFWKEVQEAVLEDLNKV